MEEVIQMGVCEIDSVKTHGKGSLYDPRMGVIEDGKLCQSCERPSSTCTGHFGYIILNAPIIHPLSYFRKIVLSYLRIFCFECSSLLLTREQINLKGYLEGDKKFETILNECVGINVCPSCESNSLSIRHMDGKFYHYNIKEKTKTHIETELIVKMFDHIKNDDIELLGIDSKMMHPKNLIIRALPVCPPSARPFVEDNGKICDDDLTVKYLEIIKQNNKLKRDMKPSELTKCKGFLEFHIKSLMDNSDNKAKHTNGRPLKSIKQRMNGKGNLLRSNLAGKRTDFSGRTVAGPDSSLRINEVGLPPQIMDNLTIPQTVYARNKAYLEKAIRDGKANYVIRNGKILSLAFSLWTQSTRIQRGDTVEREGRVLDPFTERDFSFRETDKLIRNGEEVPFQKSTRKSFALRIGDKVEMKYRDGDPILVNRQPTLHLGSMMVFKAKRIPGKTVRIPLAVTSSYNCDFDGDELNLHAPQDLLSVAECEQLCSVKNNLMSCKNNATLICMVQDALIGSFLMTKKNVVMDREEFFDITMKCDSTGSGEITGLDIDYVLEGVERYQRVLAQRGKPVGDSPYTSRCLWSLILPPDFCYESRTNGSTEEPFLRIKDGIIYEGVLTKRVLKNSHNGLVQTIYKEYGSETAMRFASNVQFVTDAWLLTYGFSIGLKDCISERKSILDQIESCYEEADMAQVTISDPSVCEMKINTALNKARDVGMKIATDYMTEENTLKMMIVSGAKGDYVNIAQISGVLGQQNIGGKRVQSMVSNGTRTLTHYRFDEEGPLQYESRGFISGSFLGGLNPREYFFHAMSGREGLVNTSCKTAVSGYIQRRMVKVMEDFQVMNDFTVRNSSGKIVQFNYGEDNYNPKELLKLKSGLTPVDIKRMVDRLHKKKLKI